MKSQSLCPFAELLDEKLESLLICSVVGLKTKVLAHLRKSKQCSLICVHIIYKQ